MSRYSIRKPAVSTEQKMANRIGRILTEDFSSNLDSIGYYLGSLPPIIFYRLETLYLSAKDEHDRIMGREVETEHYDKFF